MAHRSREPSLWHAPCAVSQHQPTTELTMRACVKERRERKNTHIALDLQTNTSSCLSTRIQAWCACLIERSWKVSKSVHGTRAMYTTEASKGEVCMCACVGVDICPCIIPRLQLPCKLIVHKAAAPYQHWGGRAVSRSESSTTSQRWPLENDNTH